MDERQFDQLLGKIDVAIKLLAMSVVEGKPLKQQVLMLSSFGLQPKQIASILGKTPNHIRVILHGIRKEMAKLESESVSAEETTVASKG